MNSLTYAVAATGGQREARFADALEAAVLIDTHTIQTHVSGGTLIMV